MAQRVAIVGGGSIGVSWAIAFARGGCSVVVHEPAAARRAAIPVELEHRLSDLDSFELLTDAPTVVARRVSVVDDLAAAVADADHVQECAPEDLALKRELFLRLDVLAPAAAVVASSSSAMPASRLAHDLPSRARCLVAHPGNPPYLLPIVELVPAPFTAPATTERAAATFSRIGMSVVRLRREVEGFVFNRLQGALLREAYCLVRDGVASVDDVDRVVRDGLGRRWSFIGPFETADLNTRGGIEAHAARLGPAYERMGAERGQHDPWTRELVREVAAQRRKLLPIVRWEERVRWRDRMLMALAAWHRRSDISQLRDE